MNKLLVCTNPYFAVDHRGCPCGVVHREFSKDRSGNPFRATQYLGARRADCPEVEREAPPGQTQIGLPRKARHHVRYVFERVPFEVEATSYNRRQVVDGALIAADELTAKRCGVTYKQVDMVRDEWRTRNSCTLEPLWNEPERKAPAAPTKASSPSRGKSDAS